MAIRTPSISVMEAKRLAKNRAGKDAFRSPPPPEKAVSHSPDTGPGTPAQDNPEATPISGQQRGLETVSPSDDAGEEAILSLPTAVTAVFPERQPAEAKIQIFLSAPLPTPLVSKSFDRLSRQYMPAKALQMILRRALDYYEMRLDNGSYRAAPVDYPIGKPEAVTIVQTSRMIPVRLIEIARAHFDPLGFESDRAFGRKLACAALAAFFQAEAGWKNK